MILTCVQPQCHVTAHSCSVLYARGWTPAGGGSFRPSRVPKNLSRLRASNTATVCRYAHSDRSGLFYFRSESPASPQDAGSSLVAFECQEDARTHRISEALGFVQPHPAGRVLPTWASECSVVSVDAVRPAGESGKRRQAVFRWATTRTQTTQKLSHKDAISPTGFSPTRRSRALRGRSEGHEGTPLLFLPPERKK